MDLSVLHEAIIIWSIFGIAVAFATPLEWFDWLFHGPLWRRIVTIIAMGPIVWVAIFVVNCVWEDGFSPPEDDEV